jgi:hypothetical protein
MATTRFSVHCNKSQSSLVQRRVGALIVAIDSFIRSRREKLVALPTHHKVPTVLPMDTHHDIPAAPE